MPIERVIGADDPRIAGYRDVAEPELVRSRGLFVAEGRLVVRRLIEDRRFILRSLLISDAALRSLEPALTLEAFAARRPSKIALLLGTEGEGLSAAAEAMADVRVRIPIAPAVDSLNLAVAAGIALHAVRGFRLTPPRA